MIKVPAETVRDSVDAILQNIDSSLSGYNRNSLLSRFNAGRTVTPDSLFIDIYGHARRVYDITSGQLTWLLLHFMIYGASDLLMTPCLLTGKSGRCSQCQVWDVSRMTSSRRFPLTEHWNPQPCLSVRRTPFCRGLTIMP